MDAEAIRVLAEALMQQAGPRATITVAELVTRYVLSPELMGLRSYKDEVGRLKHVVRLLGPRVAALLSLLDVDEYRCARMVEPGCRRGRLTMPATRNREVIRLLAMLGWAAERKLMPSNPIAGAALEPEDNQRRTTRSLEDLEAVVDELPQVIAAIVATKATSGLRRAEVVRLRKDQLERTAGRISLHHLDTKTRKPRVTILSEWASLLIAALPETDSPFVFPSLKTLRPFHPRWVLTLYQRACRKAGVAAAEGEANWLHDCRSHFIDEQLELGTPERDIRDMTGHSHLNTSAFERYVRRRRQFGAVAAAKALLDHRHAARRGPHRAEPAVITGVKTSRRGLC